MYFYNSSLYHSPPVKANSSLIFEVLKNEENQSINVWIFFWKSLDLLVSKETTLLTKTSLKVDKTMKVQQSYTIHNFFLIFSLGPISAVYLYIKHADQSQDSLHPELDHRWNLSFKLLYLLLKLGAHVSPQLAFQLCICSFIIFFI